MTEQEADLPERLRTERELLLREFGPNPMNFFWILNESENRNLDSRTQNEQWAFVKAERWHDLNLEGYAIWAISDNGDLLWWNGARVIVMSPRTRDFFSIRASPSQLLRRLQTQGRPEFFPSDLGRTPKTHE